MDIKTRLMNASKSLKRFKKEEKTTKRKRKSLQRG